MIHRENDIVQWGIDRNIIGPTAQSSRANQLSKTYEECLELDEAIEQDNLDSARDAIGDIIVTLVMQSQMWELSLEECIEAAWNQIKNRKGKLVNGLFVKE